MLKIKAGLNKLGRMRFSLSTRIVLSMAGMVFLAALASVVIFNIIITNKTRDLETNFQKAFAQFQYYRSQNQVPAQTTVDQLKAVLSEPGLSPEAQLDKFRGIVRNSEGNNFRVVQNILRDSGLPISEPFRLSADEGQLPPGSPPPYPGMKINNKVIEETVIFNLNSPVLQATVLGSLVAAIFAVLLGLVIARTVIRPLRKLEQASERIADGNYTLEVGPEGPDDLGRLARSYNKMAHALRLTEQKRKELVADVAHELRTPLSSIQGYTEVLRDGLISSPERQQDIHNHILREVRHLTTMVESMRVWMSNEQALEHLNIEEVLVPLAIQQVMERFGPTAEQKEIALKTNLEAAASRPLVKADGDALGHVLSNLVDNALRYTSAGGNITLKVSGPADLSSSHQKVVWFEVLDDGSGIPAEHLPFVFERFYRVDKSRDRATGGTGLGLAIVRDTVLAMGGEVSIKSEVGAGTEVKFWLPATESAIMPTSRKAAGMLVGTR